MKSITNIFEAFEEYERRSSPYNKYAEQLPPESKDFAAWRKAHEDFNRPQMFCEFLKSRPDLVQDILNDESMRKDFEKAVSAVFGKDKMNITVKGTISL